MLQAYSPMRASALLTAVDDDDGQIGIAEFRSLTAVTVRLVGETRRFQVGFQIAAPHFRFPRVDTGSLPV